MFLAVADISVSKGCEMADFWAMLWVTIFSEMTQRKCAAVQGDKWLMGVMGHGLCINEDIKIVKNGSQQR